MSTDDRSFALESDYEGKVKSMLYTVHGVLGVKLHMINDSGWPDHLFVGPAGRVVFVEFKRGGNEMSRRQVFIRSILKAFGHQVLKLSDTSTVLDAVRIITEALQLPSTKER